MATKELFQSTPGKMVPPATMVNEAGGKAYQFTSKHALAQLVVTGTFNDVFYATGDEQLAKVLELAAKVEPEFIAKLAIYAREHAYMKDTPALLCAVLSVRDLKLLDRVFPRVLNNGKMLRNFVQIMRSGVVGRKSFGTHVKRLIQSWFEKYDDNTIFKASVGNTPSLSDVIRMVHPKPTTKTREALYGYIIGSEKFNKENLPELVKQFEAFKASEVDTIPAVPFEMLTAQELGASEWKQIASLSTWTQLRMNLNTFQRHGVFSDEALTKALANRLRDPELVKGARVFPYQLLVAYMNIGDEIPRAIKDALHDGLECATSNVPMFPGKVVVLPDVSGSMLNAITGKRKGSTSKVRCIDVAALMAASILRRNPDAEVIPFAEDVRSCKIDPRDSVMTNAERLASLGGGGTACAAPLRHMNERGKTADLIVFVSDNQSWIDSSRSKSTFAASRGTEVVREWERFRVANPKAKMVCIDVQPYDSAQAPESRPDVINVGGFNDQVFQVIDAFTGGKTAEHWVETIEKTEL